MSLSDGAKRVFKERLSYPARLRVRRLFVNAVGACVRTVARIYDAGARVVELAETHGLDLRRAWDVKSRRTPPEDFAPRPFGAHDFLLLTDSLRRARADGQQTAGDGHAPGDATVRASVVIPVFNKVEFTFQCLRSLLREIDFRETEVIVVDNASTDATPRLLSHFSDLVRVVTNERNLGFVEACNRGAAVARGRYLVFLNNDTEVQPGWLSQLVATAERDPEVGAVGSLFLYPDGRVQEAGAIVWRDGEAFHYGWGRSPEDRRLSFAREADYCSGASLLVRRELFEQLGGFDMRYAPAYYEDADLCFGVRSLGFKVMYQPLSRVVHHEGATAGRDVRQGFKNFQLTNRAKFYEKWREVLEREHHENDPASADRAADRRRGPSVLVVGGRVPTPDRDAGSARMVFSLSILARRARPVFVSLSKRRWPEQERRLRGLGVETMGQADFLREARRGRFRVAVLSRPEVADALLPALRRADPQLKIIFDMVDAHFIRLEREHEVTGDPRTAEEAARYCDLETRLARASDLIWCNSTEDERVVRAVAPGVPVEVIPTIHELHDAGLPFDGRAGLLFVGNFAHRPNLDGVHFFMREVFPAVRERLPGVTFDMAGPDPPAEVRAYESVEGVRVLGYVPDLEPLLARARVFVAPVRFGAGVKGKIGEALAHGLPVVTTAVGAEGMGLSDGEHAMIRDDPAGLAEAVVELYESRELWQRLSRRGRERIEEYFTPRAVGEVVNRSIHSLAGELEKQ
ncbi:MAG TPA: glycosyltransferase [Pyrinomonadaceae bacterium]|nr:glycosyltransferase [Pyrinomonadaceae bacterium]